MPATAAITVRCACGRKLTAPAGSEGTKARCPACGASMVIGAGESAPRQAPPAKAPAAVNRSAANGNPTNGSAATANRPIAVAASARANTVTAPVPAAPTAGDQNDRLQSIYDVAEEMETAAPFEEVPRCPQCQAAMGGGAVLCVRCGYDSRTGQRLSTVAQEKPKSGLLAGRGGKKKAEDRMAPDGSFVMGILLSAVFALAASLVWIGFAWLTGLSIGWIAMLIGAAAGVGMQIGHRGYSTAGGFAAAGITIVAILAAKLAVLLLVVMPLLNREGQNLSLADLNGPALGWYFFSPMGFIIMLVGVGMAYKTANGSSK